MMRMNGAKLSTKRASGGSGVVPQGPPPASFESLHDAASAWLTSSDATAASSSSLASAAPLGVDGLHLLSSGLNSLQAAELRLGASERQLETIAMLIADECKKLQEMERRARDVVRSWRLPQIVAGAVDITTPTHSPNGGASTPRGSTTDSPNNTTNGRKSASNTSPPLVRHTIERVANGDIQLHQHETSPRRLAGHSSGASGVKSASSGMSVSHYTRYFYPLEQAFAHASDADAVAGGAAAISSSQAKQIDINESARMAAPARDPSSTALPHAKYVVRLPRDLLSSSDDVAEVDAFERGFTASQEQLALLLLLHRQEASAADELRAAVAALKTVPPRGSEQQRDANDNAAPSPLPKAEPRPFSIVAAATAAAATAAEGLGLRTESPQPASRADEPRAAAVVLAVPRRSASPPPPPPPSAVPAAPTSTTERGTSPIAAAPPSPSADATFIAELKAQLTAALRDADRAREDAAVARQEAANAERARDEAESTAAEQRKAEQQRAADEARLEAERRMREVVLLQRDEIAAAKALHAASDAEVAQHRAARASCEAECADLRLQLTLGREADAREIVQLEASVVALEGALNVARATLGAQQEALRATESALFASRARAAAAERLSESLQWERDDAARVSADLRASLSRTESELSRTREALQAAQRDHAAQIGAIAKRIAELDAENESQRAEIERLAVLADVNSSVGVVPFHNRGAAEMAEEVRDRREWLLSAREAESMRNAHWWSRPLSAYTGPEGRGPSSGTAAGSRAAPRSSSASATRASAKRSAESPAPKAVATDVAAPEPVAQIQPPMRSVDEQQPQALSAPSTGSSKGEVHAPPAPRLRSPQRLSMLRASHRAPPHQRAAEEAEPGDAALQPLTAPPPQPMPK